MLLICISLKFDTQLLGLKLNFTLAKISTYTILHEVKTGGRGEHSPESRGR